MRKDRRPRFRSAPVLRRRKGVNFDSPGIERGVGSKLRMRASSWSDASRYASSWCVRAWKFSNAGSWPRLSSKLASSRYRGILLACAGLLNMRDVERLIRPISQHDSRAAHMQEHDDGVVLLTAWHFGVYRWFENNGISLQRHGLRFVNGALAFSCRNVSRSRFAFSVARPLQ